MQDNFRIMFLSTERCSVSYHLQILISSKVSKNLEKFLCGKTKAGKQYSTRCL